MNKIKYLTFPFAIILISSVLSAQAITGFGTGDFTQISFGNDFSISSQDLNTIDITGNAANRLSGNLVSIAPDISGFASLELTGLFSAGSGSLTITLFDSTSGQNAIYIGGTFEDLVSENVTFLTLDSFTNSSVFSDVAAINIEGGGSPTNAVSGSFDQLRAVPEPSTYALFAGIVAFGYIVIRRSRSQA
jgi:hypothetical protein